MTLKQVFKINLVKFIWLNSLSTKDIRNDKSLIIPCLGAVIELQHHAKVYISNGNIGGFTMQCHLALCSIFVRVSENEKFLDLAM